MLFITVYFWRRSCCSAFVSVSIVLNLKYVRVFIPLHFIQIASKLNR
jgi:hypothetical protein